MDDNYENWKLKLRYGKLITPYKHFTSITKGVVEDNSSYSPGSAFMGVKIWASTYDEAADLTESISEQVRFTITDKIEIFDTEPQEPPHEKPYGYDLSFTYFQK
jgi:hypothetical protein